MANRFTDSLKFKNGELSLNLTLLGYEEEGNFVLYSPALDLYAYGDNEKEALKAFDETIHLYVEYVLSENTLEKDLRERGWKKNLHFKSKFNPPKYDPRQLMSKKGVNSFNVIDKQLALPA